MLDALVPHPPQKTMESSSCDRCALAPLLQQRCQHHHHPSDQSQAVEEYVLDERDFGHFRPLTMAHDGRRGTGRQQQRHVRRSAELRTVSIIETLSELVAGQGEGGKLDDCDGQCQRRLRVDKVRRTGTRSRKGSSPEAAAPASCSCSCPCRLGGNLRTARRTAVPPCNGKSPDRQDAVVAKPKTPATSDGTDGTSGKSRSSGKDGTTVKILTSGGRSCRRSDEEGKREGCSEHCIHGSLRWPSTTAYGQDRSLRPSGTDCDDGNGVRTSPKKCPKKGRTVADARSGGANSRSPETAAVQKACGNKNRGTPRRKQCAHVNHDPAHFMLSTLRSKGRTPDWIAGIFSIARRGNLERLSQALVGMDATLIRNLSDHRGNNLFHVCCCYGHLDSLQWLMQRGKQCEDAILDENKYELTPLVCAVKYGKLPCVEWLIQNTIARGQLVPSNGTRPLLHWAAKYGQEVILRWLAEYMEHNSMDINVKDGHGNTALHLAAKHGHAVSIKALVIHRCDASLKNDIGYKASDYASLYGQTACSEYLLSLEACLLLASDVTTLDADIYTSRAEMSETKIQFKDVLSCAKKLVKEREELSQHLDRLQDGLVHLNDVIVAAIQGLYEENCRLREKVDGRRQCENSQSIDETIALCHAMQTRWKDGQQRWLSPAALGEIQQKILLAEERWKRARVRATWEHKESKEHVDVFRERLAQVQCRATGIRLSEIRSISSSESSLASMEDTMSEYEERYELCGNAKSLSPFFGDSSNQLGPQHHHGPPQLLLRHEDSSIQTHGARLPQQFNIKAANKIESCVNPRTRETGFPSESSPLKAVMQKPNLKQNHRASKLAAPSSSTSFLGKDAGHLLKNGHNAGIGLVSQGTCKVLEVIVNSGTENENGSRDGVETIIHELEQPWTVDAYSETGLSEQVSNLKTYAKSCSGDLQMKRSKPSAATRTHCKSEILESQSKNGGDDEDKRRNAAGRSTRDRGNAGSSGGDNSRSGNCGGETQGKGSQSDEGRLDERQQQESDPRETPNELSELFEEFRMVTPPGTRAKSPTVANNGKLVSSEPDLIIGTKGIRDVRALLSALAADIPEVLTADGADTEPADALDAKDETGLLETIEFGVGSENVHELRLIEMDADETCVELVACGNGNPIKRRGFLQKLNLRWPSKRKVTIPSKKVQEISPENFRETYLHVRNGPGEDGDSPSAQLLDASCTGPETAAFCRSRGSVEAVDFAASSDSRDDSAAGNKDVGGRQSPFCDVDVSVSSSLCSLTATVSHLETNKDETASREEASATAFGPKDPSRPFQKAHSGSCATDDVESASRVKSSYPKKFQSAAEPIPAAPAGPRNIPVPPPPVNLDCQNDLESQNGYSYIMLPSRQSRSDRSRDDDDDDEDDDDDDEDEDDGDEERKESSRPEADQDIPRDNGMDIELADDQSNLIHAQANMPPQRPLSCSAKTEQGGGFLPRPASSVSRAESYSAVYRLPGYPLRKASSVSTDLLTPDSLTPSRMSPAPSEVSKTESALSPPSDISKTESVRHMRQLTRIEERGKRDAVPVPALPLKHLADVKVAAIVDINADAAQKQPQKDRKPAPEAKALTSSPGGRCKTMDEIDSKRGTNANDRTGVSVPDVSNVATEKNLSKEKPWYELSDDEEILMPETLKRNVGIAKSGSEEEDVYLCA